MANKKLVEFSKTHKAWEIVFEVLTNYAGLSESQIFQAATILKNKFMYDFAALRMKNNGDMTVPLQLREPLIKIIQEMSGGSNPVPKFILNVLCTGMAYLTIHTVNHWPSMIEDLTIGLSGTLEQGICLLQILKYMANDCDNDSIVVEVSTRDQFFEYLDKVARHQIFVGIFNQWAMKLPELQTSQ